MVNLVEIYAQRLTKVLIAIGIISLIVAILTKNTICIVLASLDGLFWLLAIAISAYAEIKFRKEK